MWKPPKNEYDELRERIKKATRIKDKPVVLRRLGWHGSDKDLTRAITALLEGPKKDG